LRSGERKIKIEHEDGLCEAKDYGLSTSTPSLAVSTKNEQ